MLELPRYVSHKQVWALKIQEVNRRLDGSALLIPSDDRYGGLAVSFDYMQKHSPEVGGYYVRYQDGYESFSPAEAFESGYSPEE